MELQTSVLLVYKKSHKDVVCFVETLVYTPHLLRFINSLRFGKMWNASGCFTFPVWCLIVKLLPCFLCSVDNYIGILSGANFEDTSMIYHDNCNTTNKWISTFRYCTIPVTTGTLAIFMGK